MTRERDLKVELVRVAHSSNIQSNLWASIDDQGLTIAGQDLGPGVEAIWGDLDYEYWLVVAPQAFGSGFGATGLGAGSPVSGS